MNDHAECQVEPVEKPLDQAVLAGADAAYLAVWGMGCPRCATRVRNGLLGLDGVLLAEVFLEMGFAAVAFDPQSVATEDLINAVSSAGDDARHHYAAEVLRVGAASQMLRIVPQE